MLQIWPNGHTESSFFSSTVLLILVSLRIGEITSKNLKCAGYEVIALACGKIDYLHHFNLTPWDHSPVYNFAKSSGCKVVLNGSKKTFNFDTKGQLLCTSSNFIYNKLINNF